MASVCFDLFITAGCSLVRLGAAAEGSDPSLEGTLVLGQRPEGAKVKTLLVLLTLGDQPSSVQSQPAT